MWKQPLIVGTAVASLAVFVLPFLQVGFYGTTLGLATLLNGWALVGAATSAAFAEDHRAIVYCAAAFLSGIQFLIVAAPLHWLGRRLGRPSAVTLVSAWTVLYLLLLFLIFPATDGP